MKKYCALLLTAILFSCGNGFEKKGNMYIGKMMLENGEGEKSEISYSIFPDVVDSLKMDKTAIEGLIKESAEYAKSSLNNPLTFELMPVSKESVSVDSYQSDSTIKVFIDYIGKNGFGVKKSGSGIAVFYKGTLKLKEFL